MNSLWLFLRSKRYFALLTISIFVFLGSCEKATDWQLNNTPLNTIVVEAMLTNEFKTQMIRLSHPVAKLNGVPQPLQQAKISVGWQNTSIYFVESDTLPGTYVSQQPFAAAVDQEYHLAVETDTLTYNASTYMVPVFPFESPAFQFRNGMYSLAWNNPMYSPFEQAMYEALISWDHLEGYDHPDSVAVAHLRHITLNTIDVSYIIFPQDTEEVFFPAGSIIVFSKYSLNDHYAAYLRAMLSETQWQGSLFESPRGNLPGNISNGGLGYFSACAVIRDTLVVE